MRACVLAHVYVRARVRLRRYELERGLLEGSVAVADLPRLWNEKMAAYLGCTPEDDGEGVLQARPVRLLARLRILCGRRLAVASRRRGSPQDSHAPQPGWLLACLPYLGHPPPLHVRFPCDDSVPASCGVRLRCCTHANLGRPQLVSAAALGWPARLRRQRGGAAGACCSGGRAVAPA